MNHPSLHNRPDAFRVLVVFTVLLLAAAAPEAQAVFRVWQGTAGVAWSAPANWSPSGAPQAGDDLHFPSTTLAANRTASNDLAGIAIRSILFNVPMNVLGLPVTVNNGLSSSIIAVGSVAILCPVVLGGDQQFLGDNRDLSFNGGIQLNGHNLAFNAVGNNSARILVPSVISGTGGIVKDGVGTMLWQGLANTFTGTLRVVNGLMQFDKTTGQNCVVSRLEIAGPGAVQLLQSDEIFNLCVVSIEAGGQLLLNGQREFLSSDIFMWDGAVIDGGGNYNQTTGGLSLLGTVKARTTNGIATIRNGLVSLNSSTVTFDADGVDNTFHQTGFLNISANIVGGLGVGFTKSGGGTLRLSGTNGFTGAVIGLGGEILAAHSNAFGGTAGGVELRGSSLSLTNVSIGSEPLEVIGGNSLFLDSDDLGNNIRGQGMFIRGSCSWAGPVTLTTNLFVYGSVVDDMTWSGPIGGPGGLTLYFSTNHFTGTTTNTYTGPTYVRCRLLTLNRPAHTQGFALKGPVSVGGIINVGPQAELRWLNNLQVSPFLTLTVHTNGFVNLNQRQEGFGTIVFNGGRIDTGPAPGLMDLFQELISKPTNMTARIEGRMRLLQPRNFTVGDGPVDPDLQINASILETAPAGINKLGPGELMLSAPNSYTGPNQVLEGVLEVFNDAALGATGAGTTVAEGATLEIELSSSIAEPVTIQGTGRGATNGALYCRFGGTIQTPITLAAPAVIRSDDTSSGLFINSSITGTGPLTKIGAGFVTFGGLANNTYTGETFVQQGRVTLQKPAGVTAIPSHLTIGTGSLFNVPMVLQNGSFQIIGAVTVNRATWNLNGSAEGWGIPDLQGRRPLTLLNGGTVVTGPGGIFYLPVGGDVSVSPSTLSGCSISGNIGLDAGPHRFIVGTGQILFGGGPDLDVPAVISQTGAAAGLVKEGNGLMRLGAANSFTGDVTVNNGTLVVSNNLALGAASLGIAYVRSNGVLALDGGRLINNYGLFITSVAPGALTSLGGSNTWKGVVGFDGDTSINVASYLNLSGQVAGSQGLTKIGPGTLQFTGSTSNNYSGLTRVNEGVLELVKVNVPAIPGDGEIGDDSTNATTAVIRSLREQQFGRTANIAVRRSGLLDLAPAAGLPVPQPTIRTVTGSGRINLGAGTSLTVSNDVSFDFLGALGGSGAFNKWGAATVQLRGDSPAFTGGLSAFEGALIIHGAMPNALLTARNSSTVGGSGSVRRLTALDSSTVAPSPAPQSGKAFGHFSAVSNDFSAGATFKVGAFLPYGLDQLNGGGALNLGNAQLSATIHYPAADGDVLPIIVNNASPAVPINGTFNGLPDGTQVNIGGYNWVIRYNTGLFTRHVELTATNLPLGGGGFQFASGNFGTALVPNDCGMLSLVVTNREPVPATSVHGTLRSLTAGVIVTMGESDYPNLAGNARGTNLQPFQIRTDASFPCNGSATLQLVLTSAIAPPISVRYTLPGGTNCNSGGGACESCQVASGALDEFSPTATLRLARVPTESVCFPPKPCPGVTNLPPARYRTHTFTNTSGAEVCVTVKLRSACTPLAELRLETLAAYLGAYDPADPCSNYLGDAGTTLLLIAPPFSFRVPAGARFDVVVTGNTINAACAGYTLELFGLPCAPPAVQFAALVGPGPLVVRWSSAYPDYRLQAVTSLDGPAPRPFSNVVTTPVLIGGQYSVSNATTAPRQFFRLAR